MTPDASDPGDLSLRERVERSRDPKIVRKQLKQLPRAPRGMPGTLTDLLTPKLRFSWSRDVHLRIPIAQAYFDALTPKKRMEAWNALFPRIAPHVERAWLEAPYRPYQIGIMRRPFRAPARADLASQNRARFFVHLWDALEGLDADVEWISAWAPHIEDSRKSPEHLGWLLSAVLRAGGSDADRVRDVMVRSINAEHEIGQMGRHIVITLLNSDRRDDWDIMGNLLITAQRQEGLRQAILESIDEAHPDAFRFMLGLILDHDLQRFSSTVRAFDVWLGMQWAGGSATPVRDGVRQLCAFFDDASAQATAIRSGDPGDVFLALWTMACADAERAVATAAGLLRDDSAERRFVALRIIAMADLLPELVDHVAARLMEGESDDRVRAALLREVCKLSFTLVSDELFDAVARLFEATPAKAPSLDPIVWPWEKHTLDRSLVATALRQLAVGAPHKLIPYAHELGEMDRIGVIASLAGLGSDVSVRRGASHAPKPLKGEARTLVLRLVTDAHQGVQEMAFHALSTTPIAEDEVDLLTANLHRVSPAFRKGAITRLRMLPPTRVLAVAEQLMSSTNSKTRAAGLELADQLAAKSRKHAGAARALVAAATLVAEDPALAQSVDRIVSGESQNSWTFDDALGLVPPGSRATAITPVHRGIRVETPAARACITQLAELVLHHAEVEIEVHGSVVSEQGTSRELLAAAGTRFPTPTRLADIEAEAREALPLHDVWVGWMNARTRAERDPDGFELARAAVWLVRDEHKSEMLTQPFRATQYNNSPRRVLTRVIAWLAALSAPADVGAFIVQFVEDALADRTPSPEEHRRLTKRDTWESAITDPSRHLVRLRFGCCSNYDWGAWPPYSDRDHARLGALSMLAMDRKEFQSDGGPTLERFVAAYDAGYLNDRDLVWLLLHQRGTHVAANGIVPILGPIREATGYRPPKVVLDRPRLIAAIDEVKARLVQIELTRGEALTGVSHAVSSLRHSGGAETLFRFATALGRDTIIRQHEWGDPTRSRSFSRLIAITAPGEADTPERFAELSRASGLKRARLLDLAMFAPQWAAHAEHALAFVGLEDAVWWIHAHTKKSDYWRDEFRDIWAARINERTELAADDLEEGAVDVAWFHRVVRTIGEDNWSAIQKPAKYASNSGGHKRAELFAESMLGRVTTASLLERINGSRHQDSLRALGLVPLPTDAAEATRECLDRYGRLQEFRRESREFGSMRQASEGRAVDIGLQNLARTAGYRDPRRLQWAMESHAVEDLARGPVVATADETTVALSIDDTGAPVLTVTKKGRALKDVPQAARKHEGIAALRSRVTDLRRQASRMRASLEDSMCRGDAFTGAELRDLYAHPMLRPMIERIVVLTDAGAIGYPIDGCTALRDHAEHEAPIGADDSVRIAHPIDLLTRGDWDKWQRECFARERVQPFKQVFREVYPKTAAELDACDMTRRYAGHQVNPRQAMALLKTRQWVFAPEEGVRRVYHDEGIIAEVWFQEYFHTPAELEGLTLEGVGFATRGAASKRLTLTEVPDRLFSETMRDMDLVVSVAHLGGVDPESSASTVEMRTTLVRETCQLLRLNNVRVQGNHAVIDGVRATYSVHLGSAVTKVMPGSSLVIVAVHSQYRGRVFLPFADDDPKSAEVLTKVLLLARDTDIKDPSILDQLRR